jgi:hypothetical protein
MYKFIFFSQVKDLTVLNKFFILPGTCLSEQPPRQKFSAVSMLSRPLHAQGSEPRNIHANKLVHLESQIEGNCAPHTLAIRQTELQRHAEVYGASLKFILMASMRLANWSAMQEEAPLIHQCRASPDLVLAADSFHPGPPHSPRSRPRRRRAASHVVYVMHDMKSTAWLLTFMYASCWFSSRAAPTSASALPTRGPPRGPTGPTPPATAAADVPLCLHQVTSPSLPFLSLPGPTVSRPGPHRTRPPSGGGPLQSTEHAVLWRSSGFTG